MLSSFVIQSSLTMIKDISTYSTKSEPTEILSIVRNPLLKNSTCYQQKTLKYKQILIKQIRVPRCTTTCFVSTTT